MLIIIISFLIIVIEKGIFSSFFPLGFIPQLLLIYFITLTNWKVKNVHTDLKWQYIAFSAFMSGIVYDFLSGSNLGLNSLLILLTIFIIIILGLILPSQMNYFFFPISIIIGSVIFNVLFYFSYLLLGTHLDFSIGKYLISQISINFIVGIVSQIIFNLLFNKFLGKKELEIN